MTSHQDKHKAVIVPEITPPQPSLARRLVAAGRVQSHRRLLVPISILVIVLVGGSLGFYCLSHSSPSHAASQTDADRAALLFPPAFLVFQNLQGGPPATNSTTTIVRTSGVVQRQFSSSYTDSAFDQYAGSIAPFSSGLLLSNQLSDGTNISVTRWSDLHASGQVMGIASTLTPTLNNIWNNSGIIDGQLFLVGANTLYGMFTNATFYNLQKINLQTGTVQTVLQVKSLSGTINNNNVQPKNMNASQTKISFLMNNVSLNGSTVETPSVVVYDLTTGKVKITALPARLGGVSPTSESQSPIQYGVSADGVLLAYQAGRQGTVNGMATTVFSTHLYNTKTGKDIAVSSGPSINLGACTEPFYFSNDDKYLVTCGDTSLVNDAIIEVMNTDTGAVVQTFDVGKGSNYSIAPVGWSGNDELVYVTNSTASGVPFNAATETAHSINLMTGTTHDYPSGLGELLMVIH